MGGSWRYTVPNPPAGPVADAFLMLRDLARLRGRRPWSDLLDELLGRTRASAVWTALRGGEARLANLDKLRALLRQVELSARSPGEALQTLQQMDKDKDLSRSDLDSDTVRITSYFKAKGLEAPIVVLAHPQRSVGHSMAAIDRVGRQVALRITPLAPRDWDERKRAESEADEAERARWMYVAATRARDHLVIVHWDKANLLDHLTAGMHAPAVDLDALPEVRWSHDTFGGLDDDVDRWLAAPVPSPADIDPTDAWHSARVEALRAAKTKSSRWRSVQEVAAKDRVSRKASPVGALGGRVVHDVLEALDLSRPSSELAPQVEPLVRAAAAELSLLPELVELCVDIVHRILDHTVIDRARAAPERWVEVPFSLRHRGRIVSGRIDLAFPIDAFRTHWVVVDWKSDLPPPGTPAWRNYERQLGWYAKALLATVSPCERVETILVGPHPELGVPEPVDVALDLVAPELVDGLRRLLEAGAAVPNVGVDHEEPIVATSELSWDGAKVALCVGQPSEDVQALRRLGWRVVSVDPEGVGWAAVAVVPQATVPASSATSSAAASRRWKPAWPRPPSSTAAAPASCCRSSPRS